MVVLRNFFLISFLCVSNFSFAESLESPNAVALASEYMPLTPGNSWTYRVQEANPAAVKEYTHTVQHQTYTINGIETVSLTSTATAEDPVYSYLTNDSNGLREHGGTFFDDNNQPIEGRFNPPLTFLGPQLIVGQTQTSSGTIESDNIRPEDQLTFEYTYTSTVLGAETVTVPAGTFATIKVQDRTTNTIRHQGIVVYEYYYIDISWLAKNVGIVKATSEDDEGFIDYSELLRTSFTPPPTGSNVKTDFDGDGKADILWRNSSTGQNYLYQMDGATPTAYAGINTVDDQNWKIRGVDDFNGDGKADILWRHNSTGQNYLYMMNSNEVIDSGLINTLFSGLWLIQGTGDFDGDGKADILWRNWDTGQNVLYLMDGSTPKSFVGINHTSQDWYLRGIADFNGDGKADILWRNSISGQNYLYMMDGNEIIDSGTINTVADLNWAIVGVADFDGDNKADILWRHQVTGQNYLYLMDGVTPKAYGGINTVEDLNWKVQGADDYNGDGNADILWRHHSTGHNYLYMMHGSAIIDSGTINTVPDLNWDIQYVRPINHEDGINFPNK